MQKKATATQSISSKVRRQHEQCFKWADTILPPTGWLYTCLHLTTKCVAFRRLTAFLNGRKNTAFIGGLQKSSGAYYPGIPSDMFLQVFPLACWLSSAADPHLKLGHKAGELLVPVVERGRRRDDKKWTPDVVFLHRNRGGNKPSAATTAGLCMRLCEQHPITGNPGRTQHASSCQLQLDTEELTVPLNSTFSPCGDWGPQNLKSWHISCSQQWTKSSDLFSQICQHLQKSSARKLESI